MLVCTISWLTNGDSTNWAYWNYYRNCDLTKVNVYFGLNRSKNLRIFLMLLKSYDIVLEL